MQSLNRLSHETLLAFRSDLVNRLLDQIDLIEDIRQSPLTQEENTANIADDKQKILTPENLDESKAILQGEIAKLERFDVVLSVIGTMKAGKSTTINAIVGREILPNRNRPMTILPTLIRHTPGQSEPALAFNSAPANDFIRRLQALLHDVFDHKTITEENLSQLLERIEKTGDSDLFRDHYHGEAEIFAFLETLNDTVRLGEQLISIAMKNGINAEFVTFPYAQYRNLEDLPLITVAFASLSEHENHTGSLTLLDTPGPNEAGQIHLKPMLDEQLRRSSAVLLILDYGQLKSNAEADIRTQLAQLPNIENDRLFTLVNKFDLTNTNSDNEEQTRNLIHDDLLKNQILRENIFAISAQKALLAQRMAAEIARIGGKPDYNPNNWIADFAKSIYPDYAREEIEEAWESSSGLNQIENGIKRMKRSSRMAAPMDKIILQTHRDASFIAIRSALQQIKASLNNIHNALELHVKTATSNTKELAKLRTLVAETKEQTKQLQNLERDIDNHLQKVIEEQKQDVKSIIRELQKITEEGVFNALETLITEQQKAFDNKTTTFWELFFTFDKDRLFSLQNRKVVSSSKKNNEKENIRERLSAKDPKKEIIFNSPSEKLKFLEEMRKIYQAASEKTNNTANLILENSFQKVQSELRHKENETQKIFQSIKQNFADEKINIKLEYPRYCHIEFIQKDGLQYSREMKPKHVVKRVKEDGFWAWCQRTLKLGGYEEKIELNYIDTVWEIEEQIVNDLTREIYLPTQEKVNEIIHYLTKKVMQSIATLKSGIATLNNELAASIAMNEGEIADKAAWIATIQDLHRRNKMIDEDIDAIRKIFASREVQA